MHGEPMTNGKALLLDAVGVGDTWASEDHPEAYALGGGQLTSCRLISGMLPVIPVTDLLAMSNLFDVNRNGA